MKYVAVGDADVAYQVVGDGPFDIVYFAGMLELNVAWDYPPYADFLTRLRSNGRLILFDRRGIGVSDQAPGGAIPTWEHWTEDVQAVLDAVGSEQAAICADLDAGPSAILFAAMQPERVRSLVLANTTARFTIADDYPIGVPPEALDLLVEMIRNEWGTPAGMRVFFPSLDADVEFLEWAAKTTRAAATPRIAAAYYRYVGETLDVRQALPLIQAPTLVLHNRQNPAIPFEHGRYLADRIVGATFVELPGPDTYLFAGNASSMAATEIAEFVTGERPPDIDRILTTVLFTDIVGSTERVAALGDQRWRSLLDAHDRAIRDQLRRFRGREINTTGDGVVASFDGPARAIRCAQAISKANALLGIDVRAGLHTGECEVRGDDLAGLAVHIAARVGALADPGEVVVSSTVKDLVAGSGIEFRQRGEHTLKGVPGTWRLFAVKD